MGLDGEPLAKELWFARMWNNYEFCGKMVATVPHGVPMPPRRDYSPDLDRLFRQRPVVLLKQLCRTLGTPSRTTVFRALTSVGYVTSYSHAGRYYTLARIPEFDSHGLWFHGEVRFSKHGSLRATVVVLVREAPAGHTHEELAVMLGLRVHDTLRALVEDRLLGRERVEAVYVYLDVDPERAAAQLEQRRRMWPPPPAPGPAAAPPPPLDLARIVDVLLAVIHGPKADAATIAARLRQRGHVVTEEQIEAVFTRYGLQKKTARSRSRHSQR